MEAKNKITIPYMFTPRDYQVPLLRDIDDGFKRACWIAHRRFGKDKLCINITAKQMFKRIGAYYYVLPTYAQGKKVIWDGRDRDGTKFTDHIPHQLRYATDNGEMKITTIKPRQFMNEDELARADAGERIPGSIFQVVGSSNIDSVVGANPVGVVFSEWALQDPSAWDYLRPILAENGGWAIFIYTVRGKNHGYTTKQIAEKYPDVWSYHNLTVEDTHAIPAEVLAQERLEIIAQDGNDDLYMQEYMNDFGIAIKGAYYGDHFKKIDEENRITKVPWDPSKLVHTSWDLGVDTMKVWFWQRVGHAFHLIDYMENIPGGIVGFIGEMKKKPYQYGKHLTPHDTKARDVGNGKTRAQTAADLGFEFTEVPQVGVDNGIEEVKKILPRCYFDEENTRNGVSAMRNYQHEFDEKLKTFKPNPLHDWSSHGADAFRTFAVGYKEEYDRPVNQNTGGGSEEYEIEFDPYEM